MKYLFRVSKETTTTLLRGIDFDIKDFDIVFLKENKKILCAEIGDVLIEDGEFVMYITEEKNIKYSKIIIEAMYK